MSKFAYCHFLAPSVTVKRGNVDPKPDADLPKIGQPDGTADKEQNPDYKSSAGWFRVLQWYYSSAANVDVSAGVSVGNVTSTELTILKYHGENSSVAYRAMFNRSPFDIEIHVSERLGQGQNKMNTKMIFRGCVFQHVASATGHPLLTLQGGTNTGGGSKGTALDYTSDSDTKELDLYKIVYQKLDLNTFGKETHCSLQGQPT